MDDRNCGRSERGDITKSSMKQNVEDVEALRKYLGLGKVFVYGHSYGGMKAQRYMIDYPESLYGVILSDTSANLKRSYRTEEIVRERGTQLQVETYLKFRDDPNSMPGGEMLRIMSSIYNYNCTKPEQIEEVLNCGKRCLRNDAVLSYQIVNELMPMDLIPELKKTHVPTLILVGKYDHITPAEASVDMHEAMPHSELHIIEDAAHECFADRPDYVFPCVADFVSRNFKPEE